MSDSFAHALRLDQIRVGDRIDLAADEAERRSIATRLDLPAISRLEAHAVLTPIGERVRVEGRLSASLQQSCAVTNDPVPAMVDEPFAFMFVPEPTDSRPDEEVELSAGDCDLVFYNGGTLDLGTAVADELALNLDPYPRSAGADAALKEAGVLSEEEAGPFAALAQLRKKLGGGEA
jgi:uncharacterized metal-binding protein YceD (DUF177 family)